MALDTRDGSAGVVVDEVEMHLQQCLVAEGIAEASTEGGDAEIEGLALGGP